MATGSQSSLDTFILPSLPPELFCMIFDSLAADRDWAALGACSLLSHRYFRHARTLLFSCITLKLRSNPNPILIHNIARRIYGLCDMFRRDPDAASFVKRFAVLDSYPVYDSQWITQQSLLPRLINKLTAVRECTFGCEVGYLQWGLLSAELATSLEKLFSQPALASLTLSNIGGIPTATLDISVQYLYLNNITATSAPHTISARSRLCYLNLRTLSLENTESAWELMKTHSPNLKMIRWRCWEGTSALPHLFPCSYNSHFVTRCRLTSARRCQFPRLRRPWASSVLEETLSAAVIREGRARSCWVLRPSRIDNVP